MKQCTMRRECSLLKQRRERTVSVVGWKGRSSAGKGILASAMVYEEMPFTPLTKDIFLGMLYIKFWTYLCDLSRYFSNIASLTLLGHRKLSANNTMPDT